MLQERNRVVATGASKLSHFGSQAEWLTVLDFLEARSAAMHPNHKEQIVFCPNYLFPQLREHLNAWRAAQ